MKFITVKKFTVDRAYVFVAQFDKNAEAEMVLPAERNEYVFAATDPLVRLQRYAVWRLLDLAIASCLGKTVADCKFTRMKSGKWVSSNLPMAFSLSHCDDVVAVALCPDGVGVDVQSLDSFSKPELSALANRILTYNEKALFDAFPPDERIVYIAKNWCEKESVFKLCGDGAFSPYHTSLDVRTDDMTVKFGDRIFIVATAQM